MAQNNLLLTPLFSACLLITLAALFPTNFAAAQEGVSIHPLGEWRIVTSTYGYRRNPFGKGGRQFHRGVDLAIQEGDSVFAWREGIVLSTGYNRISGNMISLLHPDGYLSKYHHLLRILVEEGEIVDPGQWIGKAGRTGQVTGPHLHFTLMKDEKFIDPLPYLRQSRAIADSLRKTSFATIPVYKSVQFRSQPSGRKVFLDGIYQGETPLNASVAYGEHFLEIEEDEQYYGDRRRITVEHDSEGIVSSVLRKRPENEKIANQHLDYGPVDQGEFAGILLQFSTPSALDTPLMDNIRNRWQLEAGLAWYPGGSKWFTSPWLEIRFLMSSGEFEPFKVFYPLDNKNTVTDTLVDYRIHGAAISYGRSARFFNKLELIAAAEIGLGRWTFKGIRRRSGCTVRLFCGLL